MKNLARRYSDENQGVEPWIWEEKLSLVEIVFILFVCHYWHDRWMIHWEEAMGEDL